MNWTQASIEARDDVIRENYAKIAQLMAHKAQTSPLAEELVRQRRLTSMFWAIALLAAALVGNGLPKAYSMYLSTLERRD